MHLNSLSRKISIIALYSVIAALCGILEGFLPLQFIIPVPGVKLGISNIIIILAAYLYGIKVAFSVTLIRIFTVFLFSGNPISLCMSLCGGLISFLALIVLIKLHGKVFSFVGISSVCAALHGAGQMICAYIFVGNAVLYYLPFLITACTLTGIFTGTVMNIIENKFLKEKRI